MHADDLPVDNDVAVHANYEYFILDACVAVVIARQTNDRALETITL